MIKNSGIKPKRNSTAVSVAVGTILAVILSVAGAVLGAVLLGGGKIPENAAFPVTISTWIIATFLGVLVSTKLSCEAEILTAILTNACYLTVLLGVGILFFETNLKGLLSAFLSVIAGNIPVAFILINKKPGRKRKYHYKAR